MDQIEIIYHYTRSGQSFITPSLLVASLRAHGDIHSEEYLVSEDGAGY
jgi:hypothetical protein